MRNRARRPGFTLAEVLVATAIIAVVVLAVVGLANAVQQNADYSYATSTAHQHGRVVIDRISATVAGAASSATEPPVAVIAETSSTYTFPDTLVVWRKDTNNDDIPQIGELVVYCPNPDKSSELWELTEPSSNAAVTLADAAALAGRVSTMKHSGSATKTVLTSMLRVRKITDAGVARGSVRFAVDMRPTDTEVSQYRANTLAWGQLSWAKGIHGTTSGLRQAHVRFEAQLVPEENGRSPLDDQTLTFFGSAAVFYELRR